MTWADMTPEERREAVRVLYLGGATYRAIAERLGTSRGTVAGIAARHRAAWGGEPRRRGGSSPKASAPAASPSAVSSSAAAAGTAEGVPLSELRPWGCRWPLWEHMARPSFRDARYCGRTCTLGRSYCPEHDPLSRRPTPGWMARIMTAAEKRGA